VAGLAPATALPIHSASAEIILGHWNLNQTVQPLTRDLNSTIPAWGLVGGLLIASMNRTCRASGTFSNPLVLRIARTASFAQLSFR
jgi:hypothetical protein